MRRLFVGSLIDHLVTLAQLEEAPDQVIIDHRDRWQTWVEALLPSLQEMGGVASNASADRLRLVLTDVPLDPTEARRIAAELRGRMRDEFGANTFLHLPAARAALFDDKAPFGPDVAAAFPSAAFDIEEAAKCLALERGTACAFHLMRVMELALRVFSDSLKAPAVNPAVTTNRTWAAVLDPLVKELAKPHNDRSPEWRKEDAFNSAVTAQLLAVKDAWRNPTMHIDQIYDAERAWDVWHHVRGVMRQMAQKLRE